MNKINTLGSTTYSTIDMTNIIDAINSQKRKKWSLYGGLGVWWSQALDPLQPIVHLFCVPLLFASCFYGM